MGFDEFEDCGGGEGGGFDGVADAEQCGALDVFDFSDREAERLGDLGAGAAGNQWAGLGVGVRGHGVDGYAELRIMILTAFRISLLRSVSSFSANAFSWLITSTGK